MFSSRNKHIIQTSLPVFLSLFTIACGGSSGSGDGFNQSNDLGASASNCSEVINARRISVPTTLVNTANSCDYLLEASVRISSDLTIEAGVTILAAENTFVTVDGGSITAVGESENRITIRGVQPLAGFWSGIWFKEARPSRLESVDVFDAGQVISGVEGGVEVSSNVEIGLVDVAIANSYSHGLVIGWGAKLTEFANNRFYDNDLSGLAVHFDSIPDLDTETDYYGINEPNGEPFIDVLTTFGMRGEVGKATWPGLNAPYSIGLAQLSGDDELTLAAGASYVIDGEDSLSKIRIGSGAKFVLQGTSDMPVTLNGTSGSDTYPRIEIYNGSLEIDHARINGLPGGIFAETGSSVRITNAQFDAVSDYAINCDVESIFTPQVIAVGQGVSVSGSENGVLDPNCP